MKLLLNDKEIAFFLLSQLNHIKQASEIPYFSYETDSVIRYIVKEKNKPKFDITKFRTKFKKKINKAVEKDISDWYQRVSVFLENRKKSQLSLLVKHLDKILDKLGEEKILNAYRYGPKHNFCKSVGLQIDPEGQLLRRKRFENFKENCLIRNTIGNEKILTTKIDSNLDFWFIDSGYTNFIETHKKYHRLVKNHIHSFKMFQAPADRLSSFSKFPMPWREGGDTILILEPGVFSASIFHVDVQEWKKNIEIELRKFTDKRIVFREKDNKKKRQNLYRFLCNEDIYCTISINSNGATESIWAGVPAITLDKHISNPVTKNNLNQINDLYRGSIGDWLCWLSYNQFTYDELINGYALSIIKKYYD